jgi:hypothetical protein
MLCISLSNTLVAERNICSIGVSLFHDWKEQNAVHYLEKHTSS